MIEIERKFLVSSDLWRAAATPGIRYRQGYLAKSKLGTVRIRKAELAASVTIKSPRRGLVREEHSYAVTLAEADELLALCNGQVLEKVRHLVEHHGFIWEIDVYEGPAAGLVVAEIELEHEHQLFALPPWLGAEITFDPKYRNSAIALWREQEKAISLPGRRPEAVAPLLSA